MYLRMQIEDNVAGETCVRVAFRRGIVICGGAYRYLKKRSYESLVTNGLGCLKRRDEKQKRAESDPSWTSNVSRAMLCAF